MPELNITPESKFQDIIVPTMDTIRSEYLIEMLLVNKKQLMCIGPTGTGKSLTIANKLSLGMSEEYISNFLMFSARTSANQTQVLKKIYIVCTIISLFGMLNFEYFR